MAEVSTYPTETAEVHRGRAVTPRCILAGISIIILTVLWDEWTAYYMRGSNISRSHFPMALLFPFFVPGSLEHARTAFQAFCRAYASELRVVLGMGLVAAIVPYDGVTGHLIGVLAGVYYFATPENGWNFYLHHHIPTWLAPQNDAGAMNWFYEGTPAGHVPALGAWATPLFWWTCFLGAVAFAVFCLVVMLRRQWVDHERLTLSHRRGGQTVDRDGNGRQTQPGFSLAPVLDRVWPCDADESLEHRGVFCTGFSAYSI